MINVFPFAGFPIAVFGLGRSGIASALALQESDAEVLAWDDNEDARAAAEAEGVALTDLYAFEWRGMTTLLVSPGVPLDHPEVHPIVATARAANCEVFVCARSEKSDGGGDAMGDEFEGSPPADEHAEVKPFGVAESDGSVAGHARDEVDHAEKRRRDPPSVSASSCDVQGRCFGDTAVKS